MAEPLIASVQYGDFIGTIALDCGERRRDLMSKILSRVRMAKGYVPVAFSVSITKRRQPKRGLHVSLSVYGADEDLVSRVGIPKPRAIETGELPVFEFRDEEPIEPEELIGLIIPYIKRAKVVVQTKQTRGLTITLLEPD